MNKLKIGIESFLPNNESIDGLLGDVLLMKSGKNNMRLHSMDGIMFIKYEQKTWDQQFSVSVKYQRH